MTTTKRDIAYAIAREFFPDASDDDLTCILWRYTDYPDWLGDKPEAELRIQLKAYKKRMEVKAMNESKQTDNGLVAENQALREQVATLESTLEDAINRNVADAYELQAYKMENEHLRRMLYEMTTSLDWYHAGYDVIEYDALDKEFGVKS